MSRSHTLYLDSLERLALRSSKLQQNYTVFFCSPRHKTIIHTANDGGNSTKHPTTGHFCSRSCSLDIQEKYRNHEILDSFLCRLPTQCFVCVCVPTKHKLLFNIQILYKFKTDNNNWLILFDGCLFEFDLVLLVFFRFFKTHNEKNNEKTCKRLDTRFVVCYKSCFF
jgi:hypothetical protein